MQGWSATCVGSVWLIHQLDLVYHYNLISWRIWADCWLPRIHYNRFHHTLINKVHICIKCFNPKPALNLLHSLVWLLVQVKS